MGIEIKLLREGVNVPKYVTNGAAGIDLVAAHGAYVFPQHQCTIATGIAVHIDDVNVVGLIMPRSGLGTKGLVLANTIGVIDSDYQGEILLQMWNRLPLNNKAMPIEIQAGDRIAQLLFIPVAHPTFKVVWEFSKTTARGDGGFGSTGV